ncbi:hypothetical protein [Roseburia inulinivorans]|uniref:hypothetical protein n=1 Tax=Roseburia inulinivorans TaxID=360807 RepID=UPI001C02A3EB|nr:hypothetical protein [Roseburia inulinivorans]
MNMNNKNWVSVWGNAVSIAEHHPEAYAKYITLRYPVYGSLTVEYQEKYLQVL